MPNFIYAPDFLLPGRLNTKFIEKKFNKCSLVFLYLSRVLKFERNKMITSHKKQQRDEKKREN
jgi:hypothetical protein